MRLLQGTADIDVPPQVALVLLDHISGNDLRLTLVKDADHRFSTPPCLAMITEAIEDVTRAREALPVEDSPGLKVSNIR